MKWRIVIEETGIRGGWFYWELLFWLPEGGMLSTWISQDAGKEESYDLACDAAKLRLDKLTDEKP